LAADHAVASTEIGPRKLAEILGPLKAKPSPYLYVVVEATAHVLDLTDKAIRRRLGITLPDLLVPTDDWDRDMKAGIWSATHHIGKLAVGDARFDGILYPPYPWRKLLRKQGKYNLAVFMDRSSAAMATPRSAGVTLQVQDPRGVLASLGLKL
jgi:RES domain-containing protein